MANRSRFRSTLELGRGSFQTLNLAQGPRFVGRAIGASVDVHTHHLTYLMCACVRLYQKYVGRCVEQALARLGYTQRQDRFLISTDECLGPR